MEDRTPQDPGLSGHGRILRDADFHAVQADPTENRDIVNIMLGALGTTFGAVISYYYGSTRGSEAKSALLAQAPPPT